MLEIVKYNQDEYAFPCLLVLGCFDGLHVGHAELLKKAKLQAKINGLDLGVMLFADGKGGKSLCTLEERIEFLEKYNAKFVLLIDFDDAFKSTKPLDFLACIEDKLNVKAYMSGKDFRFGQGKKGKASTLKSYADDEENGVWYMPVKDVTYGDEKVSSTLVKAKLEEGDVVTASELLGRNYAVSGTLADGNVLYYPENKFEVRQGEYQVKCTLGEEEYCGTALCGKQIELHVSGLDGDRAGEAVTVEFIACNQSAEMSEQAMEELAVAVDEKQDESVVEEVAQPVPAQEVVEETEPAPEEEPAVEEAPAETVEEVVAPEPVEEISGEEVVQPAPVEEPAAEEDDFEAELNEEVAQEEPEDATQVEIAQEEVPEEETAEEQEPAREEVPAEEPEDETQVEIAQEEVPEEETAEEQEPEQEETKEDTSEEVTGD